MLIEHSFTAMATEITLGVATRGDRAVRSAFAAVEALFEKYEASLSRFRVESELSAANRAAGTPFHCSEILFAALEAARAAAADTGGLFEPCVLEALIAAGYDKTFAVVALTEPAAPPRPVPAPADRWRAIALDRAGRTITTPPGVQLDLGGIGKGLAVDAAAALLRPLGGCYIDAGGDLVAYGAADDGPWRVGVQDPWRPERDLTVVQLRDAALATSSRLRRRWRRAGVKQHHLIDPRSGRPAQTDLVAATVRASTAARADVLAKCAVILGGERGAAFLEARCAAGLLVREDGAVTAIGEWREPI